MTVIQKIDNKKKFSEMLKKVSFKFPIAEISSGTGYSKGSVSEILKENRSPTDEFLEKFSKAYNIDLSEFDNKVIPINEPTGYYYPDVLAAAGMDTEINNHDLKRIPVNIPGWENDLLFINVYSDSMYPRYNSGEIIGVKSIEFQYLNYGYPYVIVFKNGDTYIKIIQEGSDAEHLLLESTNEFYKPKQFHLSLIKSFYSIKGVVKKEMM